MLVFPPVPKQALLTLAPAVMETTSGGNLTEKEEYYEFVFFTSLEIFKFCAGLFMLGTGISAMCGCNLC
jgi:hypothetical protein